MPDPAHSRFAPPPTLLPWTSTFLLSGAQHAIAHRSPASLLRVSFAAPLAALLTYAPLSRVTPALLSATLTTLSLAPLFPSDEVRAVQRVVWLRVASALYTALSTRPPLLRAFTHALMAFTFYGVFRHPKSAPTTLFKMVRQFSSADFLAALRCPDSESPGETPPAAADPLAALPLLDRVRVVLRHAFTSTERAFRGIMLYNFALHWAAALIGRLVRTVGARTLSSHPPKDLRPLRDLLLKATREALTLNAGVALSCWLMWLGRAVPASPRAQALVAAALTPVPLWMVPDGVADTVYFIFTAWAAHFAAHVPGSPLALLGARERLLAGVALLEGPLHTKPGQDESYAWLISFAFGFAQRAVASYTAWNHQ